MTAPGLVVALREKETLSLVGTTAGPPLITAIAHTRAYRRGAMGDAPGSFDDASPADVQATFCATLVDQWLSLGVSHAVIAPGSRSTPMALALTDRPEMRVHVVHDERVAAFVALGLGVPATPSDRGAPALLLCTSGTAAANFLPAVAEAGLSCVPMIVLTADRPEELRGVGAPQTIDQIELFGSHVRWFHDPGVPDAATALVWRDLAARAWRHAGNGPVHINLPFREPLLGTCRALPGPGAATTDEVNQADGIVVAVKTDPVPAAFDSERGVILVGGAHGVDVESILALQAATRWPIIADPTSGIRDRATVTTVDALLRDRAFAEEFAADVVVRVGRPSASKLLSEWTAREGMTVIQVGGPGRIDPAHNVAAVCTIDALLASSPKGAPGTGWLDAWTRAESVADAVIAGLIGRGDDLTEPAVARIVADGIESSAQLTVSSSMPVRDLEWFGGRRARAHCNRGANGIDGVISTALGRALGRDRDEAHYLLIGDLAFVHDSNALVALVRRQVDLRIVVVDNDGGGIFSFLPQATVLRNERFEQLFGTPLGTDVLAIAAAHGVATATARTHSELRTQIDRPGPWVCRVPSQRTANVEDHQRIHVAVSLALDLRSLRGE